MKHIITTSLLLFLTLSCVIAQNKKTQDSSVLKTKDLYVTHLHILDTIHVTVYDTIRHYTVLNDTVYNSVAIVKADTLKTTTKKHFFSFLNFNKRNIRNERDSLYIIIDSLNNQIDTLKNYAVPDNYINNIRDRENHTFEGDSLNSYDSATEDPDSLINLWYKERNNDDSDAKMVNLDSTILTSNTPDSIYMQRIAQMNSFIKLPYNNVIKNHIIYYTEKIPHTTEKILGLSKIYMPEFESIFDKYNLPYELKAMAIIESGLNPVAVSTASAKGMWQFIYTTARHYGLQINSYVDERFDPIKSCDAAAHYLSDSYNIFHSWPLAIASYNCGVGNVSKAIRRAGGGDKDFWDIYNYLPLETRSYVPTFLAALYSLYYYKEYNLTPIEPTLPPHVDTLEINKMLHFEQIAHFTGLSVDQIKQLNPQYIHNIIPGSEKTYILRLPYNKIASFIDYEDEIYSYNETTYFNKNAIKKIKSGTISSSSNSTSSIKHRVRSGESLGYLAIKYHTSINSIKAWNHIKSNNIRIGQYLTIFTNSYASHTSSKTTSYTTSQRYIYYTVKRGDNLYDISHKFSGVGYYDILKINGFTKKTTIYPGQKIKIKKG